MRLVGGLGRNLNGENISEAWTCPKLPKARVEKIMKAELRLKHHMEMERQRRDCQYGSASTNHRLKQAEECKIFMCQACELLIRELYWRAWWKHRGHQGTKTVKLQDVVSAVEEFEVYDFLVDIIKEKTASDAP